MDDLELNSKKCSNCLVLKPVGDFHKRATQCKSCRNILMKEFYSKNKEELNDKNRERVIRINKEIFLLLGDHCVECGETEKQFLTVDHIYNDRKQERRYNSLVWKLDIIEGKSEVTKYQILCRNCNEAKQRKNPINLKKLFTMVGISKTCKKCFQMKDVSEFYKRDDVSYKSICIECLKSQRISVMVECYSLFNSECFCCKENDFFKLNVDHIDNDGGFFRKNGHRLGFGICKQIIERKLDRAHFQLLCANCNYSKISHKTCIHEARGSIGL